jgi:glycosyltransferase involved in cell wall biosynthesis
MPEKLSTRQTKRTRGFKVTLVHYSAAPVVGGVESVMSMQASLFCEPPNEALVVARTGEPDFRLSAREPLEELRRALQGCDAVVVHNVLTMPFDMPLTEALWQLAAEMRSVRWFAWIHDIAACNPDYERSWHETPWNRLTQASPHFTYVAVSEHRARQFDALTGVKPKVIPNGVESLAVLGVSENLRPFAKTHRLLDRDVVLIQPARLVRRKNIELGLEVVAELRRRGRDAVTLITAATDPHNADTTAYAKELCARRKELGLEDAALFTSDAQAPDRDHTASLYVISDALLFPSKQEGFGLPVVEAALHRLPIFCTDIEPINLLLEHGVHAFAPDASPTEIATLIERTLDRSPAHRARREALRRYSWETIFRKHLAPLLER